ncbi:TRAP transporter permease [Anaerotalea alkaliphila]|uniref:TRAP transporter fused permease subunit n=1 Tax=Anaerotalea alkaliphila TaxID=2662126 RepID=A0A7X5HUE9_9FIRM|nr:TRAP transporter fused permease subunit [Anaerotalea alkaliphila]NDL66656.1 TRAP transporter fused permease subunit [Anaerotalea alkaliphila]
MTNTSIDHKENIEHPDFNEEPKREAIPRWRYAVLVIISVAFISFQLYIAMVKPLDRWLQVPYHMVFGLLAAFMFKPMADNFGAKFAKTLGWIYDSVLILLLAYIAYYFTTNLTFLQNRIYNIDEMRPQDLVAAYASLFVVMEAVRRIMGRNLFIFISIFIVYAFAGQKIPGIFQFRGMTWQMFAEAMLMDVNGILGSPLTASMNTLFYFLIFGAFFSSCGGGQVLIDLGMKLSDKTVGGPAKAAVLSSGLMGMISGSAVANVSTTGVMTIPLMKKTGYEPHQAASIESIASTGGQIMPPIMGIGAFIMAEMIGVSYLKIAAAALIPALAYYGSVFLLVHFLAKRKHMTSKDESVKYVSDPVLPRMYQLLPIAALVAIIFSGGSLTRGALTGAALSILVSLVSQKTRMSLKGYVDSMLDGVRQAASITVPTAAIGIMIGIVIQSGVANKLTKIISNTGNSSIALALIFAMVGCLLLGMALPTVAAYLIANILFGSTLINLGLHPLAANLFIFYFGVVAQITPPVCLASFTAAGIAGASPMKTGWTAFGYAFVAFLVPYVFVFKPEIILIDATPMKIALAVLLLAWGILFIVAAVSGYLFIPIDNIPVRVAFFITAVLIIIPNAFITIVGTVAGLGFVAVFFGLGMKRKKEEIARVGEA